MRTITAIAFLFLLTPALLSQRISRPNYGLISPSSAEVSWIEYRSDATEVCIVLRNEIENGFFCFDRNTRLIRPDGSFVMIAGIDGLPYCPDLHRFKSAGEEKTVRLIFPPTGYLPWFSVREICSAGCFQVLGITADATLNKEMDKMYQLMQTGENKEAYALLEKIIGEYDSMNTGLEGLLYTYLIELCRSDGNDELAEKWHRRMLDSGSPDLDQYLNNLKATIVKP